MSKPKKHRSAATGEFVSESTALADPSRHVSEAASELTELEREVVEKAVAYRRGMTISESAGRREELRYELIAAVDRLIAFRGADECGE